MRLLLEEDKEKVVKAITAKVNEKQYVFIYQWAKNNSKSVSSVIRSFIQTLMDGEEKENEGQ